MLKPSSIDKVAFTDEVRRKYRDTLARYRKRGKDWVEPEYILRAFKLWFPMAMRYAQAHKRLEAYREKVPTTAKDLTPQKMASFGFQHSDEEWGAENDIAIFVANQHRALHNQPALREANWGNF